MSPENPEPLYLVAQAPRARAISCSTASTSEIFPVRCWRMARSRSSVSRAFFSRATRSACGCVTSAPDCDSFSTRPNAFNSAKAAHAAKPAKCVARPRQCWPLMSPHSHGDTSESHRHSLASLQNLSPSMTATRFAQSSAPRLALALALDHPQFLLAQSRQLNLPSLHEVPPASPRKPPSLLRHAGVGLQHPTSVLPAPSHPACWLANGPLPFLPVCIGNDVSSKKVPCGMDRFYRSVYFCRARRVCGAVTWPANSSCDATSRSLKQRAFSSQ